MAVDQTETDVLNARGQERRSLISVIGVLKDRKVTTTSASGLSITVQRDAGNSGSFDQTRTDVMGLNADGSLTERSRI